RRQTLVHIFDASQCDEPYRVAQGTIKRGWNKRYSIATCAAYVAVPNTIIAPRKRGVLGTDVQNARAPTSLLIHFNVQRLEKNWHRHQGCNFTRQSHRGAPGAEQCCFRLIGKFLIPVFEQPDPIVRRSSVVSKSTRGSCTRVIPNGPR